MHVSHPSRLVLAHRLPNLAARQSRLLALPIELICHSLAFLDMHDLAACSLTCRFLLQLIADSPRLQYTIELGSHQMVSVAPPSMSIAAQRKLLQEREDRWKSISWKGIHPTCIPGAGSIYEFVGGVYGNGHGTGDDRRVSGSITFYQLPETGPKYKERTPVPSWTLSGFDLNIIDFSIDPTQDLLVLVASAQPGSKCNYQVHLRTLSTNEPHPKAPSPLLDCKRYPGPETADMWTSFRIQVLGKYLAVLIKDVFHTNAAFVAIWNWHAGADACCTMPLKMGIDDFCFLSPSEYMIVIPRGYLDVYSFEDPATHKNVYPTLLRRFGLPRLRPGYYYWYISATANPIPGAPHSEGTAPSSAPSAEQAPTSTEHPDVMPFTSYTPAPTPFSLPAFHARPDDGLIACSLGTLNPSTHAPVDCFVFFIRASMLLELARSNKAEASEESTYDALMAAASAGLPPMTHHHPHTAFPSFAIPATDNDQPPQPVNSLASMFVEPLDIHATSAFAEDIHDLSTFVSSPTTTSTNLPPSHQSLAAPSLLAPLPSSSVPSSPPYPSGILNPDPSPLTPAPTSPALQFSNLTAPALPAPLPPPPVAVPPFALFPPVPSAMLHPHVPPAAHVAWEDWGPRATRWFGDMLSSDWQHAVHGFRTVERVAQDPQATRHRIRVRDYNPLLVARERARDKGKGRVRAEAAEVEAQDKAKAAAGDENEKAREPAEGSGPSVRLVTEASTIRAGVAFVRDVVSWLPYREVVTEQAIEVSDVMLDDNRILCLKRGPEGQLSSMDVLTF